ncbi:hypothetical protein AB3S75_040375 [Citrus x aurantiifolia]
MTDVLRSGIVHCNDTCGCPVPCPGGAACRCSTVADSEYNHKCCSCGGHCSCNPCTCSKIQANKTGKARCSCGTACTCPTCNA